MSTQLTIKFTPLPDKLTSVKDKHFLNANLFILPEITPDRTDHHSTLGDFPLLLDWPKYLDLLFKSNPMLSVTIGKKITPVAITTVNFNPGDASRTWKHLIDEKLSVRHRDRTNFYPGIKSKDINRSVLPEKDVSSSYAGYIGQYYSARYNAAPLNSADLPGMLPMNTSGQISTHLQNQTRSFNHAAGRKRGGSEAGWKGQLGERNEQDFNNLVSQLGHFPDLLQALGLIVPISADITSLVPAGQAADALITLSLTPPAGWPAFPSGIVLNPLVSIPVAVHIDATEIAPGQFGINGFVARHDDTAKYDMVSSRMVQIVPATGSTSDDSTHSIQVDELDAIAAAYLTNNVQQAMAAGSTDVPTPGPRTVGLALNHEKLHNDYTKDNRLLTGYTPAADGAQPTPLYAEDLIRGYRIDVRSAADPGNISQQPWRSLCQQELLIPGIPHVPGVIRNEGWSLITQSFAQIQGTAGNTPYLAVPGILARWEGWSLCVPRPGNGQLNDGTTGQGANDGKQYSNYTKLKIQKKVVAGSLPKLRLGLYYQFRVRTADIAGKGLLLADKLPDEDKFYVTTPIQFTRMEGYPSPVLVPKDQVYAGQGNAGDTDQTEKTQQNEAITARVTTHADLHTAEITTVTVKIPKQTASKLTISSANVAKAVSITYTPKKKDTTSDIAIALAKGINADANWPTSASAVAKSDTIEITAKSLDTALGIFTATTAPAPPIPRNVPGREGEALDVLVVRSVCDPHPDIPEIKPGVCVRHILPPQISPDMADKMGLFDAMRPEDSYDAILHHDHQLDPAGFEDTPELRIPYLPDGEIAGFQLSGDGIDPLANTYPFYTRHDWGWPNAKPWKIVVKPVNAGDPFRVIPPSGLDGVILIELPQGDIRTMAITSVQLQEIVNRRSFLFNRIFVKKHKLDNIKTAYLTQNRTQSASMQFEGNPLFAASTIQSHNNLKLLSDDLFPQKIVTLIHAVQKPLQAPRIINLAIPLAPAAPRTTNSTSVDLTLQPATFQAQTSEKVMIYRSWHDYEDTATNFGPTEKALDKKIHDFDLGYTDTPVTGQFTDDFGDTKRRRAFYRIVNSSRFGAYFAKGTDLLRPDPYPVPHEDHNSIVLDLPATQAPHPPMVNRVIPIYRHEDGAGSLGTTQRKLLGNGLRVYLDKGSWFSSGIGEVLGVVVLDEALVRAFKQDTIPGTANPPIITLDKHFISVIGKDMGRGNRTTPVQILKVDNFDNNITQDKLERMDDWFTGYYRWQAPANADQVTKQYLIPEVKKKGDNPDPADLGTVCNVVRYEVKQEDDELYADILFKDILSYFPFVRLVLVRLQPNALPNCNVSPVLQLDYCQLPSDRTVTVKHLLGKIQSIDIDTNGQCSKDNLFYVAVEKESPDADAIFKYQKSTFSRPSGKRPEIGRLYPCFSKTTGVWTYERQDEAGLPYDLGVDHVIVVYEFENYHYPPTAPHDPNEYIDPLNDSKLRLVSMEAVRII